MYQKLELIMRLLNDMQSMTHAKNIGKTHENTVFLKGARLFDL